MPGLIKTVKKEKKKKRLSRLKFTMRQSTDVYTVEIIYIVLWPGIIIKNEYFYMQGKKLTLYDIYGLFVFLKKKA